MFLKFITRFPRFIVQSIIINFLLDKNYCCEISISNYQDAVRSEMPRTIVKKWKINVFFKTQKTHKSTKTSLNVSIISTTEFNPS